MMLQSERSRQCAIRIWNTIRLRCEKSTLLRNGVDFNKFKILFFSSA